MVVDALDFRGPVGRPDEAESELIVDADRVLSLAVTRERLQTVAGKGSQVVEGHGFVEGDELAPERSADVREYA